MKINVLIKQNMKFKEKLPYLESVKANFESIGCILQGSLQHHSINYLIDIGCTEIALFVPKISFCPP